MTRIALILLAPLVVAACAGPGDRARGFRTGGPIRGTPLVAGGVVYIASGDGHLYLSALVATAAGAAPG